jgi:hypothetical protein
MCSTDKHSSLNEIPDYLYDQIFISNSQVDSIAVYVAFSNRSCLDCLALVEDGLVSLKEVSIKKVLITDFANHRYLRARFHGWSDLDIIETNREFPSAEVFAIFIKGGFCHSVILLDLKNKASVINQLANEASSIVDSISSSS